MDPEPHEMLATLTAVERDIHVHVHVHLDGHDRHHHDEGDDSSVVEAKINRMLGTQRLTIRKLDQLLDLQSEVLTEQGEVMLDLSALNDAVSEQTTVDGSIVTLLDQIAAQLDAAASDPAAVAAIAQQIRDNNASVAAAVTANTAPTPTPSPGETPTP